MLAWKSTVRKRKLCSHETVRIAIDHQDYRFINHHAKIAQVKAICDISNAQDNIQSVVPIVLYDADGNVIDDPQLELSKSEVNIRQVSKSLKLYR